MMILITYDVDITSTSGASRLRKVAKICENYGIRVQNSVFELLIDPAQLVVIKNQLEKEINKDLDSIRLYYLGKKWKGKIETMGIQRKIQHGETLIL